MTRLTLCLVLICASAIWALGQDNSSDKGKSDTRTVTGCLQKTGHENEFVLLANDGSSWKVRSDSVSLGDHVGHTITATGAVARSTAHNMKEDTKDMAQDAGVKKHNTEHGTLKVTDVQMVSESCSK